MCSSDLTTFSFWVKFLKEIGKIQPVDTVAMPAAASENQLGRSSMRTGQVNRRCSEWRAAGDRIAAARNWRWKALPVKADESQAEGSAQGAARKGGRGSGKSPGSRSWNRQVEGEAPPGTGPAA